MLHPNAEDPSIIFNDALPTHMPSYAPRAFRSAAVSAAPVKLARSIFKFCRGHQGWACDRRPRHPAWNGGWELSPVHEAGGVTPCEPIAAPLHPISLTTP